MAEGRLPRQPLPTFAAIALLLAATMALAAWFYSDQHQRRSEVERNALADARQMIERADAELASDMRTLALLGDSPAVGAGSWQGLYRLLERTVRQTPGWTAIVLRRRDTGAFVHETTGMPDSGSLRPLPAAIPSAGTIEGAFGSGRYCPCVILHRPSGDDPDLVFTLYLKPDVFQQIVQERLPSDTVGAIVDAHGRFAARSLDYSERVGTPATIYVRRAAAKGGEGIYRGVTYEGFVNYTAYATSPVSGWSAHEAVNRSKVDATRTWANAASATGILAALALAAGLLLYGLYEMRGRRREERRLLELQKAEAISRFTGTVVHDFRNILAVVDAGIELLARRTSEAESLKILDEIRATLDRGSRLTNQLLSFVRGDGGGTGRVDLEALLEGVGDLLNRSLGEEIDFHWRVAEHARFVTANADQLELALLNLAINARDALAGPGRFTIEAAREGDMIVIAACDDGPGIPPHRREEIFELYHSTKPTSRGGGLGLAQVAGAMRQAGGWVEVDDAPGGGARFLLHLRPA